MLYVGPDAHKISIQPIILDMGGRTPTNQRIAHKPEAVVGMAKRLSERA